jgi:hypothetical protein
MPDARHGSGVRKGMQFGDVFALQVTPTPGRSDGNSSITGFVTATKASVPPVFVDFIDDSQLVANPSHPRNCHFQIHTVEQFSEAGELREFMSTAGYDDPKNQPLKTELLEDMAEEQAHNEAEFELRRGQPLVFGALLQLYSPACEMFLEVRTPWLSGALSFGAEHFYYLTDIPGPPNVIKGWEDLRSGARTPEGLVPLHPRYFRDRRGNTLPERTMPRCRPL